MKGEGAEVEILKVAATSNPVMVAGAIASIIRNNRKAEIQAIGAGAVNQAVKAIAVSRGYVAPLGIEIICVPSFIEININGEIKTGIRLLVERR
jgi:stage V sporulation protein S